MNDKYYYPKDGEQLGAYQPHLEFQNNNGKWVQSGLISGIARDNSACKYRVPKSALKVKEAKP